MGVNFYKQLFIGVIDFVDGGSNMGVDLWSIVPLYKRSFMSVYLHCLGKL